MDAVTTFLYGDVDEDIFMEVLEGLRDPKRPDLVCKLLKSLYSLKQALGQWYAKIHSFLVYELGLKSSQKIHVYMPCTSLPSLSSLFFMLMTYSLQVISVHPLIASIGSLRKDSK